MVTSTKASRQAASRRAPSSRLVATPDLLVPRPPRPAMSRQRLFEALDDGVEGRLVLISAPAGAGKTALLSTWLAERPRKSVAWMSLRPRRGENAFWAEFLEALRGVVPASTALAHLAAPRAGTPPGFVDRLLSAVARLHAPVTLVIDDFHNVPRTGVSAGIEQLLRSSSPHLRLVLSTRHDPDLPMHVFRANGELVELRAADIAFTEDEAREFLAALADGTATRALPGAARAHRGLGPPGLRLFTLSLQGGGVVDALLRERRRRLPGTGDLEVATGGTRRFLLQTSIVDRLTPDLAEALTGTDCTGTLESLVNQNLFIERVGSNPAWYRYHHLFAEILRTELLQEGPAEVAELHTRAAGWYLAHGEHVDALQHAFAAGDLDLASSCLVESWFDLLVDADLTMQTTLTDALPADRVRDSVPLTAVAATLALMSGDVRRGGICSMRSPAQRSRRATCGFRPCSCSPASSATGSKANSPRRRSSRKGCWSWPRPASRPGARRIA